MTGRVQHPGLIPGASVRMVIVLIGAIATFAFGGITQAQDSSESSSGIPVTNLTEPQMSEELRSSVKKVVVISGRRPANQAVTGSYEKETQGLIDGMDSGSRMGTITKEIGGVPVNIPIPGLAIPGAIYGALSGATKREIQDFRDKLTEEIASEENPPLRSDGLALDVFWGIRKLPNLESELFAPTVEIPNDTDAVLYVGLDDLTIDVQGKEAIITTSAAVTLHRLDNLTEVYETIIKYQDRDTLKNWTKNENAVWRNYTNFARFYLGREIAADVFDRVVLSHELIPAETDSAERARKNDRKFISGSTTPTLAWELTLDGADSKNSCADTIDEPDIFYDVEIFESRQLVYYEEQVPEPHHTIAYELEACQTYRWSVRPVYHVDGDVKFGEWMRFSEDSDTKNQAGKGMFGRQVSEAPAYTQDFALLEIECSRR